MLTLQATKQPVWAVAFSADGRWLAAGGGRADIRVWDLLAGGKPAQLLGTPDALALMFHPDGRLVHVCGGRPPGVVDRPAGNRLTDYPAPRSSVRVHQAGNVGFGPDGSVVLGGHGLIECRDPLTGRQLWEALPGGRYFGSLACGLGPLLAVTTDFRRLHRWDRARGVETAAAELPPDVNGGVLSMAFSPDGATLATSAEYVVLLWDVDRWEVRARWRVPAPCTRLAYRPDGAGLLGDTHGALRFWDPSGGREQAAYDFGLGAALGLAFDPTGSKAVAGGYAGRVVVWDLD